MEPTLKKNKTKTDQKHKHPTIETERVQPRTGFPVSGLFSLNARAQLKYNQWLLPTRKPLETLISGQYKRIFNPSKNPSCLNCHDTQWLGVKAPRAQRRFLSKNPHHPEKENHSGNPNQNLRRSRQYRKNSNGDLSPEGNVPITRVAKINKLKKKKKAKRKSLKDNTFCRKNRSNIKYWS